MKLFKKRDTVLALTLAVAICSAAPAVEAKSHGNNAQIQQVILGNFSITQQKLRSQIATYVSSGQLTSVQAANFTSQLDQVAAQSTFAAADPMQTQLIVNQFNTIGSQISSSLVTPRPVQFVGVPYNAYLAPKAVHEHWNRQFWNGQEHHPFVPGRNQYLPGLRNREHPIAPANSQHPPDWGNRQHQIVPGSSQHAPEPVSREHQHVNQGDSDHHRDHEHDRQ